MSASPPPSIPEVPIGARKRASTSGTTASPSGTEGVAFDNRLRRLDRWLMRLPVAWRRWFLTLGFRIGVPFFGAARADIIDLTSRKVVVRVTNRRQVRNHVAGVHAIAMALSAETATGVLLAMNLQDGVLPLLMRMNVRYERRSKGALLARATLSDQQALTLQNTERGEMLIPVRVVDDSGAEPIVCEMYWAWRRLHPVTRATEKR